jgi:hypothetical protein
VVGLTHAISALTPWWFEERIGWKNGMVGGLVQLVYFETGRGN